MQITKEEFKHLKLKYKDAVEKEKTNFMFKDNEILVSYAKYLIEYLESQFKKEPQWNTSNYVS